jgi:hypothetical protein
MFVSRINAQNIEPFRRYFIGGSAFMLYNLVPNQANPPSFYQINAGRWLTKKDVISVELKTWTYAFPLGIPYGPSFESPSERYPGKVVGTGVGFVYQRFLWKGLYAAAHASNLLQQYKDEKNKKIQNGYQLFTAGRIGYHLSFFNNRFFIEPSFACTYWPVNTNVPTSFATIDKRWNNYFLFEPGLHLGVKF